MNIVQMSSPRGSTDTIRAMVRAVAALMFVGASVANAALAAESLQALAPEPLQIVREVETGTALADYWRAQPVEYRVTAEAVLSSVGASYIRRDSISGSALADFLVWFGGGGGAPQDLVKLRPESATVQRETVVK